MAEPSGLIAEEHERRAAWWVPVVVLSAFLLVGWWLYGLVSGPGLLRAGAVYSLGAHSEDGHGGDGHGGDGHGATTLATASEAAVAPDSHHADAAHSDVTAEAQGEAAINVAGEAGHDVGDTHDAMTDHTGADLGAMVEATPVEMLNDSVAEVAAFTRALGDFNLVGAADGVEADLLAFIESDRVPCTEADCWFTFDRLTFETASDRLDMARSSDQLENIFQIMRTYPTLELKFGGYTDDRGDPAFNMALSLRRAEAVVEALVARGLAAERFGAEGYGAQFPVVTNDTPEGRAQNRRVDVRVRAR